MRCVVKEENIIKQKSLDFAVRIVKLNKYIVQHHQDYVLSKQLLRSGTSIGANVREALGAQSRNDFAAKMHIALKEVYETEYWLELFYRTDVMNEAQYNSIFSDCRELTNILASIVKTIKADEE